MKKGVVTWTQTLRAEGVIIGPNTVEFRRARSLRLSLLSGPQHVEFTGRWTQVMYNARPIGTPLRDVVLRNVKDEIG